MPSILVANRTHERAALLAAQLGGEAVRWEEWEARAVDVDIMISSTSAPHYVLTSEKLDGLLRQRGRRPLFLIDLAVPRDFEPAINLLDDVYLYDIDDLQSIAQSHLRERQTEIGAQASKSSSRTSSATSTGPSRQGRSRGTLDRHVNTVVFGSRGSALALVQTRQVMAQLQAAWPEHAFELHIIKTQGDRLSDDEKRPARRQCSPRACSPANWNGRCATARSTWPSTASRTCRPRTPRAWCSPRFRCGADARDVLITRGPASLSELPFRRCDRGPAVRGAPRKSGPCGKTSASSRYRGNIEHAHPQISRESRAGRAGPRRRRPRPPAARLARSHVSSIPLTIMLPAPGQGALALQARASSQNIQELARAIHDPATAFAVAAERAFLHALGGGCQLPIAGYGEAGPNRTLTLHGVAWLNSAQQQRFHFSGSVTGPIASARQIGKDPRAKFPRKARVVSGLADEGRVYLVGAGPGALDLVTVRAHELIKRADVIVYDYLVNATLLERARPWRRSSMSARRRRPTR